MCGIVFVCQLSYYLRDTSTEFCRIFKFPHQLIQFYLLGILRYNYSSSGFPTKTLYAFLDFSIRATCPAHLSRFHLRLLIMLGDHLFAIVVSMSDCHPRGPGFDSLLYPRNFSRSIESGTGSTQPCGDN